MALNVENADLKERNGMLIGTVTAQNDKILELKGTIRQFLEQSIPTDSLFQRINTHASDVLTRVDRSSPHVSALQSTGAPYSDFISTQTPPVVGPSMPVSYGSVAGQKKPSTLYLSNSQPLSSPIPSSSNNTQQAPPSDVPFFELEQESTTMAEDEHMLSQSCVDPNYIQLSQSVGLGMGGWSPMPDIGELEDLGLPQD